LGLIGILTLGCAGDLLLQIPPVKEKGEDDESDPPCVTDREHPRVLYFSPDDPDYDYYEGTEGKNSCICDEDCVVSGCLFSTCAAEVIKIDDNDEFCKGRSYSQWPSPQLGTCGCVNKKCQWYYENDYDRYCETDKDCDGLGPPPEGINAKAMWVCRDGKCHFGP
jgi:hypothetical protein